MMKCIIGKSKKTVINRCATILFLTYFVIGMIYIWDYGVTIDEVPQRLHSLVTYKYVNKTLFNRDIQELADLPELEEYEYPYYGVFIQMPMVIVEDIFGFSLSVRTVFQIRHLFTFILVFAGYICLYYSLRHMVGSISWIPLLTVGMQALYPRFYAFQFFDVKNMVFTALSMIVICMTVNLVDNYKDVWAAAFGFCSAVVTNCRIIGIIFPIILMGYYLLLDIAGCLLSDDKSKNAHNIPIGIEKWGGIHKYLIILGSFVLSWYVITPYAWRNPLAVFKDTFRVMSNFEAWNGTMVFMGSRITCDERPWYYLFVWFAITIPIIYLILFMIGHVTTIQIALKTTGFISILENCKWRFFSLVLFWVSVIGVIILRVRIYIGWHHMSYVLVPLCITAGLSLYDIQNRIIKRVFSVMLVGTIALSITWILRYHPFESSFFNSVGKYYATEFDRDEWRTSAYQALNWISSHENGPVTVGGECCGYESLKEEQKELIKLSNESPQYLIDGYRNVIGNDIYYEGYDEVYTISVDGYNVCSVFKKIEK